MIEVVPDLLRGVVSNIGSVLIMSTMIQPKRSRTRGYVALLSIVLLNMTLDIYCYTMGTLTQLAWLDFALFTMLCFAIKPFFTDNFPQWIFSFTTTQNINMAIMIVSFVISRYLPFPVYANTAVRIILYIIFFLVFHFLIRPIYRQSLEHSSIFFSVSIIICFCYMTIFLSSKDLVVTFTEQKLPILLFVLATATAYFAVFFTLKIMAKDYKLQEDNINSQSRQELMELSIANLKQQLQIMDEKAEIGLRDTHNRRNYQNTILELLNADEIEEAKRLLTPDKHVLLKKEQYCENKTVNAIITNMVRLDKEKKITIKMNLDIPQKLPVDDIEFAMVIANLLENALQAVENLPMQTSDDRWITFTCKFAGIQLALEITNSYTGKILMDQDGYPLSIRKGHGIGTKNVIAFAQKHHAQLIYDVKTGIFRVRMLI